MKQLTNMEIKRNNRNRIFRYILTKEITSNPDIAYELKMSLPTVTQNTKELLEKGVIEEKGDLNSTGGRRAKGLSVVKDLKFAIGIDITKNYLGVILLNLAKDTIFYERLSLIFKNTEEYYSKINKILDNLLFKYNIKKESILGIGISLPGIVNLETNTLTESHILNLINIHMLLDYKTIIGGYIGGYIEDYIPEIWQKILEQDIFKSDCYISTSKFKMEASALGVALSIIEKFISEI